MSTDSLAHLIHKSNTVVGTRARPMRIAVIGAGPAGFYAADALLKRQDVACHVDMFNRFPAPFGLVRDGVAPDHASIKGVVKVYERAAKHPWFRYFGNVTFGKDVTHDELRPLYDQIVYAVGSPADRRMGIPGETLEGSVPATAFVGWYNADPAFRGLRFDLSHRRAVVVGNGNVALDVARVLARSVSELALTDIADHALEALAASDVREVVVLGRRGAAQASFSAPELEELGELEGVDIIVREDEIALDAASEAAARADRTIMRNVETLRRYAATPPKGAPRRIVLRFLASPVEVLGDGARVSGIRIEKNELVDDGKGGTKARGTGSFEEIEAGLVLRSIGYRGVALPGVPFDEKAGVIPNAEGRVTIAPGGDAVPGEYVVGWAKRGPTGVIGTNKACAVATVEKMMEDAPALRHAARDPEAVERLLNARGVDWVSFSDWGVLDRAEVERGAPQRRPRVKSPCVGEMLETIRRTG